MRKKFSAFDYGVAVSRRNCYIVVSSPDFGYFAAAQAMNPESAEKDDALNAEAIGNAVLRVWRAIDAKLFELDISGQVHPSPRKQRPKRSA